MVGLDECIAVGIDDAITVVDEEGERLPVGACDCSAVGEALTVGSDDAIIVGDEEGERLPVGACECSAIGEGCWDGLLLGETLELGIAVGTTLGAELKLG